MMIVCTDYITIATNTTIYCTNNISLIKLETFIYIHTYRIDLELDRYILGLFLA